MAQVVKDRYPLLNTYLELKGLSLKAAFTVHEVGTMFDVSARSIQTWICMGRLKQRDVPGRAKIFPADLEALLAASERPSTRDATRESENLGQEKVRAEKKRARNPKRRTAR
jgi:hypothetical protein